MIDSMHGCPARTYFFEGFSIWRLDPGVPLRLGGEIAGTGTNLQFAAFGILRHYPDAMICAVLRPGEPERILATDLVGNFHADFRGVLNVKGEERFAARELGKLAQNFRVAVVISGVEQPDTVENNTGLLSPSQYIRQE